MSFEPGARAGADQIALCVPEVRGNEWLYVKECLDTGWVSSVGRYVDRFEQAVATAAGCEYGVAMVNGTASLHIALLLAGVQAGDEVLVSTLSFIAPANTIRYVGAVPRFIDAEPEYWQMDVNAVARFLEEECTWVGGVLRNRQSGRKIAAVMPVHILGHPVDMAPLLALSERFALPVIEDATESLGARYQGRLVGGLGQFGCFSFNGNKLLTTGGGGVLVTHQAELAKRAKYLTTQAKNDPLEYQHEEVGYNFRLTNLQAAMGCAQMEQLASFIERKRAIAHRYSEAFGDVPGLRAMRQADWAESTYWMFTMLVEAERFGSGSRALLQELQRAGIQSRPLWQPLHLSGAHRRAGQAGCPVAEKLCQQALSLPCSVGLTEQEQERVIQTVRAAARA